jgi:hypothetical protein
MDEMRTELSHRQSSRHAEVVAINCRAAILGRSDARGFGREAGGVAQGVPMMTSAEELLQVLLACVSIARRFVP